MQDPWIFGKNFGSFPSNFFTQRFQYFQIVNLVDCLSSWYKFIMNNPANIKFANFIFRPRILLLWHHCRSNLTSSWYIHIIITDCRKLKIIRFGWSTMTHRKQNITKLSQLNQKLKWGTEYMHDDIISLLRILFFPHSLGRVELCPSGTAVSNGHTDRHKDARWMNMEHHWNWQENSEVLRSRSQYHYVHHKPHVICKWIKLRPPRYRWRPTAWIMV